MFAYLRCASAAPPSSQTCFNHTTTSHLSSWCCGLQQKDRHPWGTAPALCGLVCRVRLDSMRRRQRPAQGDSHIEYTCSFCSSFFFLEILTQQQHPTHQHSAVCAGVPARCPAQAGCSSNIRRARCRRRRSCRQQQGAVTEPDLGGSQRCSFVCHVEPRAQQADNER